MIAPTQIISILGDELVWDFAEGADEVKIFTDDDMEDLTDDQYQTLLNTKVTPCVVELPVSRYYEKMEKVNFEGGNVIEFLNMIHKFYYAPTTKDFLDDLKSSNLTDNFGYIRRAKIGVMRIKLMGDMRAFEGFELNKDGSYLISLGS